jgi:phage shock protein C
MCAGRAGATREGGDVMTCSNCHRDIAEGSNYCCSCGANQSAAARPRASKCLMRSSTDTRIAGVCGGVAEYLDTDSTIVRLIWVLAVLFPGTLLPAFLGYFLAWIIVPRAPLPASAPQAAPSASSAQPA